MAAHCRASDALPHMVILSTHCWGAEAAKEACIATLCLAGNVQGYCLTVLSLTLTVCMLLLVYVRTTDGWLLVSALVCSVIQALVQAPPGVLLVAT
jgi:hypothetical protein